MLLDLVVRQPHPGEKGFKERSQPRDAGHPGIKIKETTYSEIKHQDLRLLMAP